MHAQTRFWIWLSLATLSSGALLSALGMPAAWFLGPMGASLALACLRREPAELPAALPLVAQAVLGGSMSAALTPAALWVFVDYWLVVALTMVGLLSLSLLNGLLLARFAGVDKISALLGMLPGGAPGMMALSDEMQADTRLVAVMQMVRVLLVLGTLAAVTALLVPLGSSATPAATAQVAGSGWLDYGLAALIAAGGAWGARLVRLPAGALVGPALLGVLLGLLGLPHPALPPLLLNGSYIVLGVWVGLQFDLAAARATGRLLPAFVLSSCVLIGAAALLGWLLALVSGTDWLTAYLATTPGGLNLVTIIALESGANVLLVLVFNLLRFLLIMLLAPPIVRWLVGRAASPQADAAPRPQS